MKFSILISCTIIFSFFNNVEAKRNFPTKNFSLRMPLAKPEEPETYLCTPIRLDKYEEYYIVGFEPRAEARTAHHMLLYGCKTPGRTESLFNCGSMTVKQKNLPSASHPCGSGSQIVYAWAQNAPNLTLPDGVGFRVGGKDSDIDYLVLQVHYASVRRIPEKGDDTGVVLTYTNVPQPKTAGVIWTASGGRIPSGTTTHMEVACSLWDNKQIHPFAYRVHTHSLGTVVSGFKVQNGGDSWELLGKENPQKPQMFYPINNNSTTMSKGDTFATRCTMVNRKDHAVWVGSTREDEMCNFYLMYWVHGKDILSQKSCSSFGPPIYSWSGWLLGGNLKNIPENEASNL